MCHILLRWTLTWAYSDNTPHTCGVFSPVTHTGTISRDNSSNIIVITITTQGSTHVFDEELRKVFMVFQTFLQLSDKESGRLRRELWFVSLHRPPHSSLRQPVLNLLSVPVVDLVDVAKDDLVFSFHVVGDSFLLYPLHEALQGCRRSSGCSACFSPVIDDKFPSISPPRNSSHWATITFLLLSRTINGLQCFKYGWCCKEAESLGLFTHVFQQSC